jgi:ribulose-5-phosphate 4-epimerase/fuculose-1-phosphate aldolase
MPTSAAKPRRRARPSRDPEEWRIREQLAAAYRLLAHFGMDDTIYTHLSARLPGSDGHYLINRYGLLFEEMTASNLVRVEHDGTVVDGDQEWVNKAGIMIHSVVLAARPDVACVMHTHTVAGMAIASLREGLLPVNQMSLEFWSGLAYHDYEGVVYEPEQQQHLPRDLGDKLSMVLRNHRLLTAGRTIPEAFYYMYYLEMACRTQVAALQMGREIVLPAREICDFTSRQFERSPQKKGQMLWEALVRRLDRENPSYRN